MRIAARLEIYHNLISRAQRQGFLVATVITSVVAMFFIDPVAQDPDYHVFADSRSWLGIPNASNVLSNIGFAVVGGLGLWWGMQRSSFAGGLPALRKVYLMLFFGIFLTAFGSSHYHLSPNNNALVWDRLPMTIAFMAFFAMVLGEQVSEKLALILLGPLIIFGVFSVAYWHFTEQNDLGDLRLYALVQFLPIILIPLLLILFPSPFESRSSVSWAIGFYVLAKVFELFDDEIYRLKLGVAGHALKHLCAAVGTGCLLWALNQRRLRKNFRHVSQNRGDN